MVNTRATARRQEAEEIFLHETFFVQLMFNDRETGDEYQCQEVPNTDPENSENGGEHNRHSKLKNDSKNTDKLLTMMNDKKEHENPNLIFRGKNYEEW